jgi:acyl-coenzyme A synthetase/AMP-(fatty) acid ligase
VVPTALVHHGATFIANLARFKVPARWDFVAAMPRTPLGKIQKFKLQHELAQTGADRCRSPGRGHRRGAGASPRRGS